MANERYADIIVPCYLSGSFRAVILKACRVAMCHKARDIHKIPMKSDLFIPALTESKRGCLNEILNCAVPNIDSSLDIQHQNIGHTGGSKVVISDVNIFTK